MPDAASLFRKGSLIPDILSFEVDLIERVDAARTEAEKTVADARDNAEQRISDTKRRLPRIIEEQRNKLTEQAQEDTSTLEHDQAATLGGLQSAIKRNHTQALDTILARVVPATDDRSRS